MDEQIHESLASQVGTESVVPIPTKSATCEPLKKMEERALALAKECFGVEPSIEDNFDPEYPDENARVVVVSVPGESEDLINRSLSWHRKMIQEFGAASGYITIYVDPQST
jgi:hypothetical protein